MCSLMCTGFCDVFWVSWGTSYFCHLFQPGAACSLICIVFQGRMLLKTRQIVYAVPTCKVQNFVTWDLSHGNVFWAKFELQWWARTSRATNPWNITWSQHCFGARCGFVCIFRDCGALLSWLRKCLLKPDLQTHVRHVRGVSLSFSESFWPFPIYSDKKDSQKTVKSQKRHARFCASWGAIVGIFLCASAASRSRAPCIIAGLSF